MMLFKYSTLINHYKTRTDDVDFSRLNFPFQTVKEVKNFERKIKEDVSFMELYVKSYYLV